MNQTDVFLVQIVDRNQDKVIYNILYHEKSVQNVIEHLKSYYHINVSEQVLASFGYGWIYRSENSSFLKTNNPIIRIRNLSLMETQSSWID